LAIYDVRGHLVRALVDGDRAPGAYRIVWNGRDDLGRPAASGVYFYRIEAGEFRETKRMVLIK
jgi:flagellar hook assembly protein FlgD